MTVIGFGVLGRMMAGDNRAAEERVPVVDRADDVAAQVCDPGCVVVQGNSGMDDPILGYARLARAGALVMTAAGPERKLSVSLGGRFPQPGAENRRDRGERTARGAAPSIRCI